MNTKTYSTKANARRAAKSQLGKDAVENTHFTLLTAEDGTFGWEEINEGLATMNEELDRMYGFHVCPGCGTHLDNGVGDFESLVELHGEAKAREMCSHQYYCMACDYEFGNEIEAPKAKATRGPITNKSTVERPTKLVWDIAESMTKANPQVKRKEVLEECVKQGVAYYTARTQYQQWLQASRNSQ